MLNESLPNQDSIDESLLPEIEPPKPIQPLDRLSFDPPLINPWRNVKSLNYRPYRGKTFNHAAPLSPIRDQDLEVMSGWFDRADITEIEQDVEYHLALLYPEPPWEDSLDLNFLQDHL